MGEDKETKPDQLLETGPSGQIELSEQDLDKVAGGKGNINDITFGVQKDKMQSANKNAEAVKSLL